MSNFEVWALVVGGLAVAMLFYIARALEVANNHYSNIANRLLDIGQEIQKRR